MKLEKLQEHMKIDFNVLDKSHPEYQQRVLKTGHRFRQAISLSTSLREPASPDLDEEALVAIKEKMARDKLELESAVKDIVRILGCESMLREEDGEA